MTTLISILLATLIFGGRILYLFLQRRKTMQLMPVEAGPTSDAGEDFMTPVTVRVGTMPMDASLQYFVVRNECMAPLHINSGDIIGVQLLDEDFTLADIQQGDILLIRLDDDSFHGHKIRVMDHTEGQAFCTYYFVGQRPQPSSKPHAFNCIRGVVREINHPFKSAA